jgi:hypothetical protein
MEAGAGSGIGILEPGFVGFSVLLEMRVLWILKSLKLRSARYNSAAYQASRIKPPWAQPTPRYLAAGTAIAWAR